MGQIIREITDLLTVRFRFKQRNDVSEKVKIIKISPKIITIYLIKILLHQIELLINLLLFRSRSNLLHMPIVVSHGICELESLRRLYLT
jgi:hypothetical protein